MNSIAIFGEPVMLTRLERYRWHALNLRQPDYFKLTSDEVRLSPNADPAPRLVARCLDISLEPENRLFARLKSVDTRAATINLIVRLTKVEGAKSSEVLTKGWRLKGGESLDISAEFAPARGRYDYELITWLDLGEPSAWAWVTVKWPTIYNESFRLRPRLPPLVDSEQVVVGKKGWLFLNNDTNANIAQLVGERSLSADEAGLWAVELRKRAAFFAGRGIEFVVLVAPNKESVFPQYLPEYLQPASHRIIDQFLQLVPEGTNCIYPASELAAAYVHTATYSETDTHWTDYGALLATNAVLAALRNSGAPGPILLNDASFVPALSAGDLGGKCSPAVIGKTVVGESKNCDYEKIFDNDLGNTGRIILYKSKGAIDTRLLIFGDSFAHPMFKWLIQRFGYLIFVHSASVDAELVDLIRPDAVVTEIVERFIASGPKRIFEYSFSHVLRDKLKTRAYPSLENWINRIKDQDIGDPVSGPLIERQLAVGQSILRALKPVPV